VIQAQPTIAEYLRVMRNMILVPNSLREIKPMTFDQRHSEYERGSFQTLHETRGQSLIDMYGKGLSREEMRNLGIL